MDTFLSSTLPGTTTSVLPIEDGGSEWVMSGKAVGFDNERLEDMQPIQTNEIVSRDFIPRLLGKENWLIDAVEKSLTHRQFRVFELHYIYGYKQETVSNILGCSQQSVSTVLMQAIQRLRKRLGPMLEPILSMKGDQLDG